MLTVWREISTEATSDVDSMTRLNSPTEDLRATESDVPPKRTSDTTVKVCLLDNFSDGFSKPHLNAFFQNIGSIFP